MCYSAQVIADYKKFVRAFGATMDIHEFARLFFERAQGASKSKIPKAMEDAFGEPQTEAEREIKALIGRFNAAQTTRLEQELFKQRKRLADAERTLQTKVTKAATESQRIATDKIAWTKGKLEDLQRTGLEPRDSRIFPRHSAPVW
jgi:TolA-binding protein